MKKKYEDFEVGDFVSDKYFWKWIKEPSQETDEFWETWMRLHPDKKNTVQEARQLLLLLDFKKTLPTAIDTEALFQRISSSIKQQQTIVDAPVERSFGVWRWAAVFLIAVVSGFTLYYLTGNFTGSRINLKTAYGENETVELPDKSVVILNANSTIQYTNNWNDNTVREVWLKGEAFFKVRKSPGKGNAKFIVHTDQLSVEVLGTEFDVTNRRGKTQVVLSSGSVRLRSDQALEHDIMMKPGELAELSDQNKFVKRVVNAGIYSAWKEGKFIFNKTALKEIIQLIEDTYGFDVQLDVKGINDETFTGVIPSADIDNLLKVLSESYDIKITKSDKQLRISR